MAKSKKTTTKKAAASKKAAPAPKTEAGSPTGNQ